MKNIKLILIAMLLLSFGCTESYIDEIVRVEPGADVSAPEVNITYPLEGTLIRVVEDVTPINIIFEVIDDIEIESVQVNLDGTQIAIFEEFLDFRRFVKTHTYPNLSNGIHVLTIVAKDVSGKTTTKTVNFEKVEPYTPVYEGETFYLPFDGDFTELVKVTNPTVTGNPGFADGVIGRAYAGTNNANIAFPTINLLSPEFSAVFWYKVNGTPDRAGLMVIGPPDTNNPTNMNNRNGGFRLFRENAGGKQRIKLNIGTGSGEAWFDGGAAADIDPAAGAWSHVAFTISGSQAAVYINGQVVSQGSFSGIDWAGCDLLSIASGAPRFAEWGHLSDASLFDELRLFNKALTQTEIQAIITAEKP
ncbi:LamG domain-containing protein [Aquiflexum sp. TKW24L]|uniref:LamG-like jellyroll fold domain-containing protein n=1 Tax=Aquiflexum sp. TKW24L TaxID=2942212 RepID=UPI0020BDC39B|nr:LamG-like jellyroll fold domain-containing protein [Aquiflexum sp. TKW24L]MCL6259888.1 LamG domain-containing protein [Aquiflexum sp. TKW24L]